MKPQPYCTLCKIKFTREYNLNVHNRTKHSKKIKKIRCPSWPTCKGVHKSDGLYSTVSNLTVHYKKHHPNKRLSTNKLKWIYVNKNPVESEDKSDESEPERNNLQNENNAIFSDDDEDDMPLSILRARIQSKNIPQMSSSSKHMNVLKKNYM